MTFRSGRVIPCQGRDHASRLVRGRCAGAFKRVDRLDKLQEGGALRRWRKDEALRRADAEFAQMQHLLEAFAAFRNHVQPRNG